MVRLGVLGCGDVAFRTYFNGLDAVADEVEVAAVCDPVAERSARAAERFPGATAYTRLDDLLRHPDLDGALNLTPAPLHRETTARLLEAGLHVYSEKPLAGTLADGQELIDRARAADRLLLCAPAAMATPRVREMQRHIADGIIGRPTHAFARLGTMGPAGWADYTGDPAVFYGPGVGPAIDLGVYLITTITGFFGPATRVQAMGGILIPERISTIPRLSGQQIPVTTPDLISMQLAFADNRYATIIASFAMPANRAPIIEIVGETGILAVADEMSYWVDQNIELFQFEESAAGPAGWSTLNVKPEEPILFSGPRHFAACIRGEETPVTTAEHALHVLEVMLAAQQSINSGESVALSTAF